MANDTTTIQKKDENPLAWLTHEITREKIAKVLPDKEKTDRFLRLAIVAFSRNPALQITERQSVLNAMIMCGSMGLMPDGREGHLIPYGKTCTFIADWKGIMKLVRNSGEVSDVFADIICDNDAFEFQKGKDSFLSHKYDIRKPRGKAIGAYSFVTFKDGNTSFDVMSAEEIEVIRKRSKSGGSGPWVTDWNEMAKKTVFRRHSKSMPLSSETREKIMADSEEEVIPPPKQARVQSVQDVPQEPIADFGGKQDLDLYGKIRDEAGIELSDSEIVAVCKEQGLIEKFDKKTLDKQPNEILQMILVGIDTIRMSAAALPKGGGK